jgi:hypothetical protein
MAGRPRGSAARDEMLRIRMTSSGMSALDRVRGSVTRSDYVRRLISDDVKRKTGQ